MNAPNPTAQLRPPYRQPDTTWLERDGSPLPHGFLWGAATAAFQVEGGYNGAGQPRNNWAEWERRPDVGAAGEALRFWDDWQRHLDLAVSAGLTAFRLSLDWTRIHPHGPDEADQAALQRYANILSGCRARGLEPIVTLHHFTHPAWLDPDPWLDVHGPDQFERFATGAVTAVNRALTEQGVDPITWWVTINEPNIFAFVTYLLGAFPHAERNGSAPFRRALDHLLTAHVRAYDGIHRVHERERWPRPMVAFNTYCMTAYELDRALLDLALAREQRVPAHHLQDHLRDERDRFEHTIQGLRTPAATAADRTLARLLPQPDVALPGYVAALDRSGTAAHDYTGVDYYVGPMWDYLRSPFKRPSDGRRIPVVAELWETTIRPQGLRMFVQANATPERPVLVAENGMCTRVKDGRTLPRSDGWTRPAFIRAHVAELLEAARGGANVAGYVHWTLADNYEWGSYEPAFGLFGVDRRTSPPRILATDAQGLDSAGTYRRIIESLRSGDGTAAADALAG